jgi:hypothetical protein
LIVELETRVEKLKDSEVDMKNLLYREKEAREVLEYDYKQLAYECDKHMELRIASYRDLVNCYKSLQKLNEDCESCGDNSKNLKKPHFQLQGYWCIIRVGRRLLHWLTG